MKKKTYKYLINALIKDLENTKNKAKQNAEDRKTWEDTAERNTKLYFEVETRNRELELENQMLKKEVEMLDKLGKNTGGKAQ